MRHSPRKKIILSLAAAAALPVLIATGSSPASAATSFSTGSSSATISGSKVTVKATVKASSNVTVQDLSVCVRDASNRDRDFSSKKRITVTRSGTAYSATASFEPGSYSYFPCVQYQNRWWEGTRKTFTVKKSSSPAQPTPAPTPTTPPTTPSPTPTQPPVTTPPTSEPVPTAMPVGDLPGWKQNFKEDFTKDAPLGQVGNAYGMSMRGYDGFTDTSKNGTYAPDKVLSVKDGKLNYAIHSENGKHLVAAPTLNDYRGQTYGRYSIRFRADSMPGYKIAFLQWPNSDNWNEGEIDWPEGNLDDGMMRPALAVPGTLTGSGMKFVPSTERFAKTSAKDWHVATTEWTPSGMKWYWDGELVGSSTEKPTTNFRWTLQAETEIGGRVPANDVKGNIEVDWATSYSYAG